MSKRRDCKSEASPANMDATVHLRSPGYVRAVQWSIAIGFTLYVVYRIFALDLTNDEWGSLKDVYHKGFVDLITFKYVSAQSHFLQSLLSILCLKLFPGIDEVVAIRLPSLVGCLIYLFAAVRITSLAKGSVTPLIGMVALCANAFVLDFFGLARGYGLAMGFMLLSLWCLICVFRKEVLTSQIRRYANLAAWCGALAVLSNLSWLNIFAATCLVLLWAAFCELPGETIIRRIRHVLPACQGVVYVILVVGVFYLPRVLLMRERGELYFGGTEGFVRDTVLSLIKATLYMPADATGWQFTAVAYGVTLFLGSAVVLDLWRLWHVRNNREGHSLVIASGVVSMVLAISCALILCLNVLFDVRFVLERAALGLLILCLCQLVVFAASLDNWWRKPILIALFSIAVVGALHLNLTRTSGWRMNSQIKEFVQWVGEERAKTGRHLIIGTDTSANYTMWYYVEKLLGLKESEQTRAGIGFVRIYNGVTIYSLELPEEKALFDTNTDYVLLRHRESVGKYPQPLRLIRQYRSADCDLFACEGGRGDQQKDFKPFNGSVYPVRFYRQ